MITTRHPGPETSLRIKKALSRLDRQIQQRPMPTLGLQLASSQLHDLCATLNPSSEIKQALEMLIGIIKRQVVSAESGENIRSIVREVKQASVFEDIRFKTVRGLAQEV